MRLIGNTHYDSVQEQLPEAEIYVYEEETEKKDEMQASGPSWDLSVWRETILPEFLWIAVPVYGNRKTLLDYVKGKL